MRLWHQKLIPYLPRQQLLGQHRECCALRGKGWGKKHATVDYVFTHSPSKLVAYHWLIMREMNRRGYKPDETWIDPYYRGKTIGYDQEFADIYATKIEYGMAIIEKLNYIIYNEHNKEYLKECLENLKSKGIEIEIKGEENGR